MELLGLIIVVCGELSLIIVQFVVSKTVWMQEKYATGKFTPCMRNSWKQLVWNQQTEMFITSCWNLNKGGSKFTVAEKKVLCSQFLATFWLTASAVIRAKVTKYQHTPIFSHGHWRLQVSLDHSSLPLSSLQFESQKLSVFHSSFEGRFFSYGTTLDCLPRGSVFLNLVKFCTGPTWI